MDMQHNITLSVYIINYIIKGIGASIRLIIICMHQYLAYTILLLYMHSSCVC